MQSYSDHTARNTVVRSPFGEWMLEKMHEAGIGSMLKLSAIAGLNKSHPPMLACGYCHPSPVTAKRIADALGVTFDELWAVAEKSRREWGRKRRSGEIPNDFVVKLSFYTTSENAKWLKGIAGRGNRSRSRAVDRIITKARQSDHPEQFEFIPPKKHGIF